MERAFADLFAKVLDVADGQYWSAEDHQSERAMMGLPKTAFLFAITAVAEIVGCYLPFLWLRQKGSPWLLVPAAISLAIFVWLLTLHPDASGRIYAAYGGVYVATAITWLWCVDGVKPTTWDVAGVLITLVGMSIIVLSPRL